ncbi:MAG TPA: MFS transporter [Candidatus Binatia bacterium]|jgi:MFS family permease
MDDLQVSAATTAAPTLGARTTEATASQKRSALLLVGFCHTLNHLQHSINSVLFPVMMRDLGFGFLQLGFLSAVSGIVGQSLEVTYGFLTGYFRRTTILGAGNVIMGISTLLHSVVGSYPQLMAARVAASMGSSPQHPLGSSILSRYFPERRGWALTLHHTAGSAGSFIGPAVVSILLLYAGWRTAFVVFGLPTLILGMFLFTLQDRDTSGEAGRKRTMRASWAVYLKCLRNRNIILTSLVLMVGAAGRGTGINSTYLVPFFMERFGVTASGGGFLLTLLYGAGLVGPLAIGLVSDRFGRRAPAVQGTLLLSALMTIGLAQHDSLSPLFYLNLLLYGCVVQARSSLTQAMLGDFVTEEMTDAAFSIFFFVGFMSGPIWLLIIGYVMEHFGFTPAFYVAASTYIAGMLLLLFVKE